MVSLLQIFLLGSVAKLGATLVTYPLLVIKVRLAARCQILVCLKEWSRLMVHAASSCHAPLQLQACRFAIIGVVIALLIMVVVSSLLQSRLQAKQDIGTDDSSKYSGQQSPDRVKTRNGCCIEYML
jgi:hypothetical protein